jgi:hypothetical protein
MANGIAPDQRRRDYLSAIEPVEIPLATVTNLVMSPGLVAIGVAIGAAGIYIGDTDDAPGAALIGILLMIGAVALGVRTARRKT